MLPCACARPPRHRPIPLPLSHLPRIFGVSSDAHALDSTAAWSSIVCRRRRRVRQSGKKIPQVKSADRQTEKQEWKMKHSSTERLTQKSVEQQHNPAPPQTAEDKAPALPTRAGSQHERRMWLQNAAASSRVSQGGCSRPKSSLPPWSCLASMCIWFLFASPNAYGRRDKTQQEA